MRFNPFGNKYQFDKDVLTLDFPIYMRHALASWLVNILDKNNLSRDNYLKRGASLTQYFHNTLQLHLRELYPGDVEQFVNFVFENTDRTANIIALILQNYARAEDAVDLEIILQQAGSGYEVQKTDKTADEYKKGVYDLIHRVQTIIKEQSEKAITENELLFKAWNFCYARNPDYTKCVVECQNFLEQLLRDKYEPKNNTPQLGKIVKNLQSTPQKLTFKGDSVLTNKETILLLIKNIIQFRGMHTAGTGKIPNKEEAEYILHTTIYIWNLHQK